MPFVGLSREAVGNSIFERIGYRRREETREKRKETRQRRLQAGRVVVFRSRNRIKEAAIRRDGGRFKYRGVRPASDLRGNCINLGFNFSMKTEIVGDSRIQS